MHSSSRTAIYWENKAMRRYAAGVFLIAGVIPFASVLLSETLAPAQETAGRPLDPTAWGSDHVGKQLPLYMTGDECLFCHRADVGNTFQSEPHNVSMRIVDLVSPTLKNLLHSEDAASFASDVTYVVGGTRERRFLKPNGAYGQFAIHTARWKTPPIEGEAGELRDAEGTWDNDLFADRCVACHATAVETKYKASSAPSLDCFVCHGDVPSGHQNKPELAMFARGKMPDAFVEISACGQCHLRGGTSRTSGLPYPNQFVPGDNLFRDYAVDLSDAHIASMNPGDRHVFENVRDVVLNSRTDLTCTTCHDVHGRSTRPHRVLKRLERGEYCAICHDDPEDYASILDYEMHSDVCQY